MAGIKLPLWINPTKTQNLESLIEALKILFNTSQLVVHQVILLRIQTRNRSSSASWPSPRVINNHHPVKKVAFKFRRDSVCWSKAILEHPKDQNWIKSSIGPRYVLIFSLGPFVPTTFIQIKFVSSFRSMISYPRTWIPHGNIRDGDLIQVHSIFGSRFNSYPGKDFISKILEPSWV